MVVKLAKKLWDRAVRARRTSEGTPCQNCILAQLLAEQTKVPTKNSNLRVVPAYADCWENTDLVVRIYPYARHPAMELSTAAQALAQAFDSYAEYPGDLEFEIFVQPELWEKWWREMGC